MIILMKLFSLLATYLAIKIKSNSKKIILNGNCMLYDLLLYDPTEF